FSADLVIHAWSQPSPQTGSDKRIEKHGAAFGFRQNALADQELYEPNQGGAVRCEFLQLLCWLLARGNRNLALCQFHQPCVESRALPWFQLVERDAHTQPGLRINYDSARFKSGIGLVYGEANFGPDREGGSVSTKQPPGPRSVVRVEKRAPELNSTISAEAITRWRSPPRRSASVVAAGVFRLSRWYFPVPWSYISGPIWSWAYLARFQLRIPGLASLSGHSGSLSLPPLRADKPYAPPLCPKCHAEKS